MRKIFLALLAAGGIAAFSPSGASAMPISGPMVSGTPDVEQARLYCMNRYTGRFLYWGRCGGYHRRYYRRHYYHRRYWRY
jgi:hypothetical protein